MKKQLLLVRHANAKSIDFKIKDFDRPLNEKGIAQTLEMSEKITQKNILPDAIISSPALRAINTAILICNSFGLKPTNIILEPAIYEASVKQLLQVLNKIENRFNLVAIFGHNPGLTMLADYLTNSYLSEIPTCGMVMIKFEVDNWGMISAGSGELMWEEYPKR